MSRSFTVNLNFSGQVVLEKVLNDLSQYLHVCDLSFEEDLAHYLKKLEFPSP
jgi:hypothetical protein